MSIIPISPSYRHLRIQTEDENTDEPLRLNTPRQQPSASAAAASVATDALVDQNVISRWLSIVECAMFFAEVSSIDFV